MNHPKISLIVPVYNVEKYLRECLDSCINQTLREIEIICINDASPDGSAEILAEYEQKDDRITIVTHKENRGLGGARNSGVSIAAGEYIWFIDSDDFISPVACELLYNSAVKHNAEIVRFHFLNFRDGVNGKEFEKEYQDSKGKASGIFYPQVEYKKDFYMLPGVMFYIGKRELLKKFLFRERIYYEDADYTAILFYRANSILSFPYALLYYRRLRPGSIMSSSITPKHATDLIALHRVIADFIKQEKLGSEHFIYKRAIDFLAFAVEFLGGVSDEWIFPYRRELAELQARYKQPKKTGICFSVKKIIKYLLPYSFVRVIQNYK